MNIDPDDTLPPPPLVSIPLRSDDGRMPLPPPAQNSSSSANPRPPRRRMSEASRLSNRSVGSSSRRSNASRRSSRKKREAEAAAAQLELNRQLASLQLPHMPASIMSFSEAEAGLPHISMNDGDSSTNSYTASPRRSSYNNTPSEPPTIRILVVADIDLESASALAESALSSTTDASQENPLQRVDLCIACGPFCQEDDLRNYYQGRQRRRHMTRHAAGYYAQTHSAAPIWSKRGGSGTVNALLPLPPMPHPRSHAPASSRRRSQQNHHQSGGAGAASQSTQAPYAAGAAASSSSPYPFKRTREETAALEGLMTAAISQLESIVCRVVFVPGKSDPLTTITSSSTSVSYTKERRLTPNSRNIHQHWIPLCPGLGCAGLLYLDGQKLQQEPPPLEDDDDDEEEDDDDDDDEDHNDDDQEDSASNSSNLLRDDSSFSYHPEDPGAVSPASPGSQPPPLTTNNDISTTFEERVQEYGSEFCHQLQNLVQLAPPIAAISETPPSHAQITELLQTERFQSILVTQFHHLEPDDYDDPTNTMSTTQHSDDAFFGNGNNDPYGYYDDDLEEEDDDEEEDESFDPPWPPAHEPFCALPHIQEHVLLEIAAGRNSQGKAVRPMELPKGPTMRVVLPGSLRERGEFCLVDVAFMKATTPSGASAAASASSNNKQDDYRWRVRRTRFQTISDYV